MSTGKSLLMFQRTKLPVFRAQKAKNGSCTTSHPSSLCLAIPIAWPVLSLHNAISSTNNLFFFDYP